MSTWDNLKLPPYLSEWDEQHGVGKYASKDANSKTPASKTPGDGPSKSPDPSQLKDPPQKEDPQHPDILVPPDGDGAGKAQVLLRWDANVGAYTVIGVKGTGIKTGWNMLGSAEYASWNKNHLENGAGKNKMPPPSANNPDYFHPPNSDKQTIYRYNRKTKEWEIVGTNVNGKATYFDTKATTNMVNVFKGDIATSQGFQPPLPEPREGVQPQWGADPNHPSYIGSATNGDGKKYLWAWDKGTGRYVAIGEIDATGKKTTMYNLNKYREANRGPDALRPPKEEIPKGLPKSSAYGKYSDDIKQGDPKVTLLVPPKPPGTDMVVVEGYPVYRTLPDGTTVMVGIQVPGDPTKKTSDSVIYFRPDEYQLYNPGGKSVELPKAAPGKGAGDAAAIGEGSTVTQDFVNMLEAGEKKKAESDAMHYFWNNSPGATTVEIYDAQTNNTYTFKVGDTLTAKDIEILKRNGYL